MCLSTPKGGESRSQAFLAETVETGGKKCNVTNNIQKFSRAPCMFCEESLGKINVKDVKLFRTGRSTNSIA